jgi:hypothetical protein
MAYIAFFSIILSFIFYLQIIDFAEFPPNIDRSFFYSVYVLLVVMFFTLFFALLVFLSHKKDTQNYRQLRSG